MKISSHISPFAGEQCAGKVAAEIMQTVRKLTFLPAWSTFTIFIISAGNLSGGAPLHALNGSRWERVGRPGATCVSTATCIPTTTITRSLLPAKVFKVLSTPTIGSHWNLSRREALRLLSLGLKPLVFEHEGDDLFTEGAFKDDRVP